MSTPEAADTPAPGPDNAVLDLTKLHSLPSEQQELYLLTFIADLVQSVATLGKDELAAQQKQITQELFKVVKLSSPAPTRVIRNNVGRCFGAVFGKGNRAALYDTATELLRIVNAGKSEADLKAKFAAAVAIGDLFAAVGDGLVSLASVTCTGLLKLLKLSQNNAGFKSSIFTALRKVIVGIGAPLDEATAKDVWKHTRNAAVSDKANAVQASACYCLENLVKTTKYFANVNDYEQLKTTIWKVIDSPSASVRHAAAACLAAMLVASYRARSQTENVPTIRRPKKASKKQATPGEEDEIPESPQPPSTRKPDNLSFQLPDLLNQLSAQYTRSSTTNRARSGIVICYKLILRRLGVKLVEDHYAEIADHFLSHLLSHPTVTYNRYRLLTTRKFIRGILEDTVGCEILRESSQLSAAKWLVNDILKDYPQVVQERREPGKHTLAGALSALSSLMTSLGSALGVLGDSCRDALLQVLQHPSYTVQIHTAQCLRDFVLACPQQLLSCVTVCMNSLTREINQLSTPRQSTRRCLGYAHGLAAMLSTSRLQPLYGSVDVYSQVLTQATDLLKTSSNSELRIASTQIQVAWILIGGLMPLGPSFTKIHLSQLLLLWKNALPKPLSKDNMAKRGPLEISFLAHVRECALGSIYVFLEFNSKLVTADGSRRLASMLQNTIMFLDSLPKLKTSEDISQRLSPSLQLKDFATMIRRRVLQCFSKLVGVDHLNHAEVLSQSNVLGLAISSFADPDVASADSSIASSSANFETLWDMDDNFGFGVTGLVHEFASSVNSGRRRPDNPSDTAVTESGYQASDDTLNMPICQAKEHDSVLLYSGKDRNYRFLPDPPNTEVVNAAIDLFAVALPLQTPKVQESSVEQIATLLSAQSLNRNPGRKAAMAVNTAVALRHSLKISSRETSSVASNSKNAATEKIMQELLQTFVNDPDPIVRCIGAEGLGFLCNSSGNTFTNTQINALVDTIVENRDPNARAGCAVALGCIHSQVGGMAAGFHLKTIVGVLMSLCSDPHPIVHYWSLEGLRRVIDSAGLTFSAYVSSSLGMLARLYFADTHNEEAASIATSNLEVAFPTPVPISRCVDSLINVLGPDLRDMSKTRELTFTLVKGFQMEESVTLVSESSRCLDHLSMYSPSHMDFPAYVRWLQQELSSTDILMRDSAIRGLNNLMKRDAELVVRTASPSFEDELWLAFDTALDNPALTGIIRNWLQQTALTNTEAWVQRFQKVLTKTRSKIDDATAAPPTTVNTATVAEMPDEEVAGFAAAEAGDRGEPVDESAAGQELLKWQTRNFVMSCLSELLSIVDNELLPDQTIPAETTLQEKVGDIIRMAFSASTANVVELRVRGLKIIDQVLKMFGRTPDPDFAEASLLEQYQAQIGSALTPAFAADSSPELASEAINVCATFVGTGIVTNVDRMSRIFKPLATGLENFARKPDITEIGDLKGLNSNARVMIKLALYSAWARLQIASNEHNYLATIVQPYTAMLTPLWLSSLQEFARLRFEPDISGSVGSVGLSDNLDDVYAALNRETLLKFYQETWLSFVDAIASLVEKDSDFVFDALDGKLAPTKPTEGDEQKPNVNGEEKTKGHHINYRDEPVAFFFVLFGIAFEALVDQTNSASTQRLEILQALKKILHPSVAGNAVYQDAVFSETMDTLDRLVMTEGSNIQTVIVEIARNLSLHHHAASREASDTEHLSDDIEQLFELTRNIILVLAGLLPNLGESSPHSRFNVSDDAASLIRLSLSSLVDVTSVFPSIIRADLRACILHIFSTILATGICQAEVVPQALPIFRRCVQGISQQAAESEPSSPTSLTTEDPVIVSSQIRGCVAKFLGILSIAQRRESEASLPCAKNTLLALTILLTTSSHVIPPQDPLIPQVLNEFLDCLQDLGLANVAAGCIRSVLLNPGPRSATDDVIARYLFPRLVAFVTGTPWGSEIEAPIDPENTKSAITQTLVSCVGSATIPPAAVPTSMSIIIPVLLVRARKDGEPVYKETATRLLELAQVDQITFRAIIGSMDPEQRTFTENIIRSAGAGAGTKEAKETTGNSGEKSAPSIALRMDF